jgi:hypothetical protein
MAVPLKPVYCHWAVIAVLVLSRRHVHQAKGDGIVLCFGSTTTGFPTGRSDDARKSFCSKRNLPRLVRRHLQSAGLAQGHLCRSSESPDHSLEFRRLPWWWCF